MPLYHAGRTALLVLPVLLSLWQSPSAYASEVRESVLTNGLKVLLIEVPKAPVVTVQVWYKVGSRNEVMGRAGLSHMLEHMMFKGTAKYPKGTFSRTIRKNGGNEPRLHRLLRESGGGSSGTGLGARGGQDAGATPR